MLLSPYQPHSWWHAEGRRSMVKRLEAKGFPSLWGWLFLTLTIDPDEFDCPAKAYEAGADRVRRMVHNLRELGYPIHRYFSKLELHESGFPHWHLGLDCRECIPNHEVEDAWGLGFTKTKRVRKTRDFRYLFKYVVKDNGELPEWVLDYPRRIRVFQTSVGFYGEPSSSERSAAPEREDGEKKTLRVKFSEWSVRGVIRVRELSYRGVAVDLRATYPEIFIQRVESGARALDAYHVPLQIENIEEYILPWKPNQPQRPPNPHRKRSVWDHSRMGFISSVAAPSQPNAANSQKTASPV
ncbi:MAG: hypothetical protein QM760_05005 [Nibricoccus sp.]